MSYLSDAYKYLTNSLYPKGRAFQSPPNGFRDRLNKARNLSYVRLHEAQMGILDAILPDNDNFTADDATQWERRLGIINGGSTVTLANRKAAILQKMAYPGTVAPRCAADYITAQLQLAGFNVKVYENIFLPGPVTKKPFELLGLLSGLAEWGAFEWGEVEWGEVWADSSISLIANYIEEDKDSLFIIPPTNYRSTFYIADPFSITSFATVQIARKKEFRQLALRLKPEQTVGFLFVLYV